MKKQILLALTFVAIAFCLPYMSAAQSTITQDGKVVIGNIDTINSEILGETRTVWIHVPESTAMSSSATYPVVYLLDGSGHFPSVSGMIRQLSTTNGNMICPEMIVVGILNTNRTKDLTPTVVESIFGNPAPQNGTGGGEKFTDFIEKELMPYIKAHYPANDYTTFIGHSLGGLMVVHTLLERPGLFDNYIALDPSLWWDGQIELKRAQKALAEGNFNGKSLYLAVANTLPEGMSLEAARKDTSAMVKHIQSIMEFAELAEANDQNGLNFAWKYYPEDGHGSVPLIGEYDAIRFLFPWYEPKLAPFFDPNSTKTSEELVQTLTSHFENVSNKMGFTVLPNEGMINSMGYGFMGNNKPGHARALFELNIRNYPESANTYDSMGDFYLSQSNMEKAAEYFSKAIEVGDYAPSKEKLAKLKETK
ncbi:MAG: alpha/beta hydrolase [Lewinellaceae bacterium]|nr:alpha/beta hydrolase [Lewinellaceae bacterium]